MNGVRRIAVIAGDGIGPEVMAEATRLLEWLRVSRGLPLQLWELDLGAERWLAEGVGLPDPLRERIGQTCDAVLLAALGDPRIPGHEHAREILFGLRFGFDLYSNVRPARALADRLVPLAGRTSRDVDLVVFRENTEGLYAGIGGQLRRGSEHEIAIEEDVNTRRGVERIVRSAFEHARASGRPLCLADKSNALRHAHELWQRVFLAVRAEYSDVRSEHLYIDALCYELVRDPARFGVIVCCNLFGDIVSDLAAALAGGLGLQPSMSVNPESGAPALFEPVHGSAPALAELGRANPIAMLRSVGLLLQHFGHTAEYTAIERAAADALQANECTPDVGGSLRTREAADAVLDRVKAGVD